MTVVGLTGGIGSGKSTVAAAFVARGAALVDADRVAREVVEPGTPALAALVERFGPEILRPDGTLDRQAVADRVFGDPEALEALNAITHPAIGVEMIARKEALDAPGRVVVMDIPLLKPFHREMLGLAAVVVVDCPVEVALDRLVRLRGMDAADASARIASQMDRAERVAAADFVIDNGDGRDLLDAEVERVWAGIVALEAS